MIEKRNWKEAKLEQTRPAKQDNFVIIERQSFANFGKNESFHDFLFSSYVTALYRRVIDTAGVCTDPPSSPPFDRLLFRNLSLPNRFRAPQYERNVVSGKYAFRISNVYIFYLFIYLFFLRSLTENSNSNGSSR